MPTIELIIRITENNGATEEKRLMVWPGGKSEHLQSSNPSNLLFCGMEIYLKQRRVLKDGVDIHLSKNEYNVLVFLAQHSGEVFTKEQIFEAVWHENSESCLSAVTNTISRIRHKIESVPEQPIYICTVSNLGYTFAAKPLPE
ncbi:winged helix family transcriptional regulator [bacterium 1xD42-67]|nr:winged helix family transcriptional regulator [bacterium 1xD42-67]